MIRTMISELEGFRKDVNDIREKVISRIKYLASFIQEGGRLDFYDSETDTIIYDTAIGTMDRSSEMYPNITCVEKKGNDIIIYTDKSVKYHLTDLELSESDLIEVAIGMAKVLEYESRQIVITFECLGPIGYTFKKTVVVPKREEMATIEYMEKHFKVKSYEATEIFDMQIK